MAAAFTLSVMWLVYRHGVWTSQLVWRLPWAMLGAFAGAGIGKLFGIGRARSRFNREIEKLLSSLKISPASEV